MLFKKSQVTLFIILGLILLLTLGIFLYIAKTGTETPFETVSQTTITDKQSLKVYVEECIKQVSLDPIVLLGKHGGIITPITYKKFEGTTINYFCTEKNNILCVNSILLKQDMEKELSREIKNNIDYCLNFEALERQGFSISKGEKETDTIITNKKIIFNLNYPITLSREGTELTLNTFTREIENPLGELYLIATDILNKETSTNQFNQIEFIKQNPGILIQKHKPYPDVIYTLKKDDYTFQFALEGTDTVSTLTQFAYTIDQEGCCYINNTCYANTLKAHCDLRQGYYETWPCECSNNHKTYSTQNTETQENYKSCDNKQHGESWCEYDSIAGRSYDYVGTRHYLHYCIDGEEYIEPCRDYREELCTEKLNSDLTTKATCRVNRWQDCSKCETKDCCEDTSLRDCYWRDWLDTEKKCSPFVPPGFKFWDYNGMEVCNYVNEKKYCEGFSCPNKWIDDSAVFCYSQGDCGNYRNVNDKLTKYGYFNSDFSDKPRDYVYLDKGNTKKGDEFVVALQLATTKQAQLSSTTFIESKDNLLQLISAVYEYIDSISYLSVSDFLNPFTPKPELEILDLSICSVWQAPRGGKHCDLCTEDPEKPCTEYKCKSLGQECIYEEPEGIPGCYKKPEEDSEPVTIQINTELLSEKYQINSKTLTIDKKQIKGYEITPAIIPHRPFTFGIKTNKETICTIHYTPQIDYINLPLFFLGEPIYSTEHNVTLRMPPKLSFPQKIMDVMNITTITEFAEILEKPRELIDTYKERFSTIFAAYKLITGTDAEELIEPFVDDALYFISLTGDLLPFYKQLAITIIEKFEQGGYILFIQCTDRSGNTNEEDIFIEFEIDEITEDTFPPEIIHIDPQNKVPSELEETELYLYLDEPAECKYSSEDIDYNEMENEFTCATSKYDLSPIAGGTYECSDLITLQNTTNTTIFIRCKDNPPEQQSYELRLFTPDDKTQNNTIYGQSISKYANITENEILVSSNMLKSSAGETTLFQTINPSIKFSLFLEELQFCQLKSNNTIINLTDCQTINELDLGFYSCSDTINTNELNTFTYLTENNSISGATNGTMYNFTINCFDLNQTQRNTNTKSHELTITKSSQLEIINAVPSNGEETESDTTLTVTTSESSEVQCAFNKEISLGLINMIKISDNIFQARLSGLERGYHSYYISCTDKYMNSESTEIEFYVVED